MTLKKLVLFFAIFLCQLVLAQKDTILLKEVVLSDYQLNKFSNTKKIVVFNDSIINQNKNSLTFLLNNNSTLYFKENGLGMVSSVSFRGTTAQQTAVIWNGININSVFNGQTDFNTITTNNYDNIAIRFGGESAIYGSSAIGGSIHLNNELNFEDKFKNQFTASYGSFNTTNTSYKIDVATTKFSSQVTLSRNSSSNDYEFIGQKNKKNTNGQFYNSSINANFGYNINPNNYLKLYSETFESERHFSGTISTVSKSKYQDLNLRSLLEWNSFFNKFSSKVKVAFLSEKYKYFEDFNTPNFESAEAKTIIAKHELNYKVNTKIYFQSVLENTQTKGFGDNITLNKRSISSITLLMNHQLFDKLNYEISARKEVTNIYQSPFLFSVGTKYSVSKKYNLKFNISRNFRIPSFNDLYWNGLGNINLKPETANQIEFGQQVKVKNFDISGTVYFIKINDLIQWKPNQSGNWTPNNVAKVQNYGAEVNANYQFKIVNHQFKLISNYGYTISKDETTNKQLIYVPFHKATTSLVYNWKHFYVNFNYLYTGYVYTSSDNFYFLKSYQVSNLGLSYDFGNKKQYKIGCNAYNIWNENYQSVAQRPMPGRNYSLNININF